MAGSSIWNIGSVQMGQGFRQESSYQYNLSFQEVSSLFQGLTMTQSGWSRKFIAGKLVANLGQNVSLAGQVIFYHKSSRLTCTTSGADMADQSNCCWCNFQFDQELLLQLRTWFLQVLSNRLNTMMHTFVDRTFTGTKTQLQFLSAFGQSSKSL